MSYNGRGIIARQIREESEIQTSDERFVSERTKLVESRVAGAVEWRRFSRGYVESTSSRLMTRDHLGSVRDVNDSSGNRLRSLSYAPFGAAISEGSGAAPPVAFNGFGEGLDEGLLLAPLRVYDSGTGRWLSEDPLGRVDGPNLYAFVRGNPVNYADPLGLRIRCYSGRTRQEGLASTPCGTGGCTQAQYQSESAPCKQMACSSQWGFDAVVLLRVSMWFSEDPARLYSPGKTLGDHEEDHAGDYLSFCQTVETSQSEGFSTQAQCELARRAWEQWADQLYNDYDRRSADRDGRK